MFDTRNSMTKFWFFVLTLTYFLPARAVLFAQTWAPLPLPFSKDSPQAVKAVGFQSPVLLAAEKSGVYLSSNGGLAWERVFRSQGSQMTVNRIDV